MTEARPDIRERFGMADSGGHARLALRMSCLALLCCLAAFVFALVPAGLHCTPGHVQVHRCEAHAVTPGNLGAKLLTKVAEAAGLPEGQLIATTAGVIGASTGMNLANSDGIEMGATAAHNLGALIDAADYPAWDTLDSETQAAWGTKYDYDAAKYCDLLTGLGYGDLVTEFYSSGGGNFDPSDDEAERLQQLGRIGQNWANGAANAFGEVLSMFTNKSALYEYLGVSPSYTFNGAGLSDWPSGVPTDVYLGYGSELRLAGTSGSYGSKRLYTSSPDVYYWINYQTSPNNGGCVVFLFSKDAFMYGRASGSSGWPALPAPTNEVQIYDGYASYYENAYFYGKDSVSSNMPVMRFSNVGTNFSNMTKAIKIMLREGISEEGLTPDIPEYPEATEEDEQPIPNDTPIYYPADGKTGTDGQPGEPGGINPDTTWPDFITPPPEPEKPRPDNPYNPQNPDPDTGEPTTGTGTPEWREETTENVLPLLDIKFDQLFPFSMLFDITKMFDKVEEMTQVQSGSGVYTQIVIPIQWGGDDVENMVLDLAWLYQLLLMVRVFNQLLLAALLLFTAISFWRTILTG